MFITVLAAMAAFSMQDPQTAELDKQDAKQHAEFTNEMKTLDEMRLASGIMGGLPHYNLGLIPIHDVFVESIVEGTAPNQTIRFEGFFYLGGNAAGTWPPATTDPNYPRFYVRRGPDFEPTNDAAQGLIWTKVEFDTLTYTASAVVPPSPLAEGAKVVFRTVTMPMGTTFEPSGVAAVVMRGTNKYKRRGNTIMQDSLVADEYGPKPPPPAQSLRIHGRTVDAPARPRSLANNIIPITWIRPLHAPSTFAPKQEWVYANTLLSWTEAPMLYYVPDNVAPVLGATWTDITYDANTKWKDNGGHPDIFDFDKEAKYVLILAHGESHVPGLSVFQWSGIIREVK